MACHLKKIFKTLTFIIPILFSVHASAQISFVQNAIDKLEGHKNFSYRSVNRKKELFTADTATEKYNAIFEKAPNDKNFGYLFNIETLDANNKLTYSDVYNGNSLIRITPQDSTYEMQDIRPFGNVSTLPGCLKWLKGRLELKTCKIARSNDTTINGIDSYHLVAFVYDSVINREHNFTYAHLYINKLSNLPDRIAIIERTTAYGDGVSNYYSESNYSDYNFDQANISIASITIPKGFHLPVEQADPPKEQTDLLATGTVAPNWTLEAADGKKMSLSQMKGKVVLLDFFFIGCGACMESLKPLNKIYEKYKNQNVAMLSLTERDSKQAMLAFENNYHINYPGYVNTTNVIKSYHVPAFPTFYIIDQQGKISSAFVGYDEGFEGKVTSTIDGLLKK